MPTRNRSLPQVRLKNLVLAATRAALTLCIASITGGPLCAEQPASVPLGRSVTISTVGGIRLTGHITVLSFADPKCGGPCLRTTESLASLKNLLRQGNGLIQFVTVLIPMQPISDYEVKEYADQFRDKDGKWKFIQPNTDDAMMLARRMSTLKDSAAETGLMNAQVYVINEKGQPLRGMPCFSDSDKHRLSDYVLEIERKKGT